MLKNVAVVATNLGRAKSDAAYNEIEKQFEELQQRKQQLEERRAALAQIVAQAVDGPEAELNKALELFDQIRREG